MAQSYRRGPQRVQSGSSNNMDGTTHQAALLLRCLGRYEPHVCPGDRLADGLSVGGIVLVSLDVALHVGRRHQAHRMTKSLQFARPMMGRRTCFDAKRGTAGVSGRMAKRNGA